MLFALFFGAGNLIYPAYLGQQAGENWLISMPGFLLTGAGLPLLGVIAIGYSGSRDVEALASRVAPWYGVAFAASLYLAIGPLFAMPRTATVSFEIAVLPLIGNLSPNMAQAVFSLLFFGLTYWLSMSPGKLVDRIGKILTPALLLTIAVLVGYAALNPIGAPLAAQGDFAVRPMIKGILEGYGTMDALASLVFAIIVIDAVRAMGVDNRSDLLKTTAISGLMAAGCLAAVYLLIGYMGATSVAGIGLQENGALVLSKSAQYYFGLGGNLLLGVIVLLACLTTAVGLVTSCAEYFNRLCPGISYKTFVIINCTHPAGPDRQAVRQQPHRLFLHHNARTGGRPARCIQNRLRFQRNGSKSHRQSPSPIQHRTGLDYSLFNLLCLRLPAQCGRKEKILKPCRLKDLQTAFSVHRANVMCSNTS